MNQTFKQRSALVRVAESGLNREPSGNRGDYILAAIGICGCTLILILNLLGVA